MTAILRVGTAAENLIETAAVLSPIQQQFVATLLRRDPALVYDDVAEGIIFVELRP